MDRGLWVVFSWQMGWYEESKKASLICLTSWHDWKAGLSRFHCLELLCTWPLQHGNLRVVQLHTGWLRVLRVSVLASKVKDAWPFITWPLKSHSITSAVPCGWSNCHKPTPIREEGFRPPTSQTEEYQSIYSWVFQSSQLISFLSEKDYNMFKCH